MEQKNSRRGGARPNSGRPKRDDKTWGQITCVLRKDTIAKLRAGCGGASKHFGPFLQDHLDRHPLPDRETYEFWKKRKELRSKPPTAAILREIREREREMFAKRRAERKRLKQEKWAKANPEAAKRLAGFTREFLRIQKRDQLAAAKAAKEQAKAAAA